MISKFRKALTFHTDHNHSKCSAMLRVEDGADLSTVLYPCSFYRKEVAFFAGQWRNAFNLNVWEAEAGGSL